MVGCPRKIVQFFRFLKVSINTKGGEGNIYRQKVEYAHLSLMERST
jgi:hypothetical protein